MPDFLSRIHEQGVENNECLRQNKKPKGIPQELKFIKTQRPDFSNHTTLPTDPDEMANTDTAALAARLRALPYAADLRAAAGLQAAATDAQLVDAAISALVRYQTDDSKFHPFTSKFDAVEDGRASFTA